MNEKKMMHYEAILPEVAKQSSEMERRADEAERETEKLKKWNICRSISGKFLKA